MELFITMKTSFLQTFYKVGLELFGCTEVVFTSKIKKIPYHMYYKHNCQISHDICNNLLVKLVNADQSVVKIGGVVDVKQLMMIQYQ